MKSVVVLVALTLSALCSCQGTESRTLKSFRVELREKETSCRELDPQVATEIVFIEPYGDKAVLHLGSERAFPVNIKANTIKGEFIESDHTTIAGRHVVCKSLTEIDLTIEQDKLNGTYKRKRRQDCMLEAKPCSTTWSVDGKRIIDKPAQ